MCVPFSQGPTLSEPAMSYVPTYILVQVDCFVICQKYI